MEPSRVWKNLLSGKQAVPTVACPSCGAQVPEFRIHSHLDTCLTTLPADEEEPAVIEAAHELSDGEQTRHRRGRARGQARGRGRGRKRREGPEIIKKDTKRARNDADNEKVLDAPALSDDDDDVDANVYQRWEYSVDELAKSRNGNPLSDLQKQELFACGVLTIDRHEGVSAMVLELDRLLADTEGTADVRFRNGFQIPALSEVGVLEQVSRSSTRMNTADAEGLDDTQPEHGKALEAWWEQWVTVEWPDGPLPSGYHAGLPQKLPATHDVHTDTEKIVMGKSAAQEMTSMNEHAAPMSTLNYSESGGVIEGESVVMPPVDVCTAELLTKSDRIEAIEVGMKSGLKISNEGKTSSTVVSGKMPCPGGEQFMQTKLSSHSKPNVEHSAVAESARKAGPSSPSTAPANNPCDTSGASPGLQACPICNKSFPPNSSNRDINKHIDEGKPVPLNELDSSQAPHIPAGLQVGSITKESSKTNTASSLSKQGSTRRDATGSSAMSTDGSVVDSRQQDLGLHGQNTTGSINYQAAYVNATLATGGSVSDNEPGVDSPVQAPHPPADSLLSVVAGPVVANTKTVREVELGPGITLGHHSLNEYSFITSLPVIEEQH